MTMSGNIHNDINPRKTITVVKVGGAIVEDAQQLQQLIADFSKIEGR